jgi:SagB-type dehydrogenase family enzyme
MKKNISLKHKLDYNSAMDLLTSLLDKIQFELIEDIGKKPKNNNWEQLITHNKSYIRLDKIKLVKPPKTKFSNLLSQRSSIRNFDPNCKVDLKTLSAILSNIKDNSINDFPKRSFPSAGALYPSNTYCIVNNSLDIEKGLYFFNHKNFSLELLLQRDLQKEINKAICDKKISNPSVVFILTSSYYKSCLKYGARGFLYALMEIGSLAQTLNLSFIESGWDCVWLGGFSDNTVKEILDINDDLEIELPVLLIAAGKAANNKRKIINN